MVTESPDTVRDANVAYHDLIADRYDTDASTALLFTDKSQGRLASMVNKLREQTRGELWVDVGCGTGNVLRHASRAFNRAVGFDVSPGMLRIASERGFDVNIADACSLPLSDASVDVVSTMSVLHHLFDPKIAIAEFHRVLRPGGFMYADLDPNGSCIIRRPLPRAAYRQLYTWYLQLRGTARAGEHNPQLAMLEEIAEYHQNRTTGLNPRQLVRYMQSIGFRSARVFLSFATLDPARLDTDSGRPSALAAAFYPLFSIVGQK